MIEPEFQPMCVNNELPVMDRRVLRPQPGGRAVQPSRVTRPNGRQVPGAQDRINRVVAEPSSPWARAAADPCPAGPPWGAGKACRGLRSFRPAESPAPSVSAGVVPGAPHQLIIVSQSTRAPTSSNSADYNSVVNAHAALNPR